VGSGVEGLIGRKGIAMAKIRHIAIISSDPEKLAAFYEEVFDLEVLHRADNGSVFMTDGYMNVALLTQKAQGKPNGLNHFGFVVDDHEEMIKRFEAAGAPAPRKRPADRHYAEYRAVDPEGNNFDLSENGFQGVRPDRVATAKETEPVS
jgi:catechol 2,3-dioxygenase-like lactoylglutathione lyase family enzyme